MSRPRERRTGSYELPELPSFRFDDEPAATGRPAPAPRPNGPAPRVDSRRPGSVEVGRYRNRDQAAEPWNASNAQPIRRHPASGGDPHAGSGLVRHDVVLSEALIDEDAAKVVRRLEQRGFEAYLVGGCVRDLLLNLPPKDFDIATSARPEDVRMLFRNCRIIGRRFRLAHVRFGADKVIEVATFRRNPTAGDDDGDDVLIRDDNAFGEAPEDARRRDFTINALFYDLEKRQVLDWCGGMADISARAIRTIGEPAVRFREDPVRILRAVKFAARLDLGLTPEVYDALVQTRHDLERAAPPRVSEEILRLLRGGAAHRSMWLLWELGAMAVLLPDLAAFLDDDAGTTGGTARFYRRMRYLDSKKKEDACDTATASFDDLVLWAALLIEPIREATHGAKDPSAEIAEFLEPLVLRRFLPRRAADGLRRLIPVLPRLEKGDERLLRRMVESEWFGPAIDLLEIELIAKEKDPGYAQRLRKWGETQRIKSRGQAVSTEEREPLRQAPGAPRHASPRSAESPRVFPPRGREATSSVSPEGLRQRSQNSNTSPRSDGRTPRETSPAQRADGRNQAPRTDERARNLARGAARAERHEPLREANPASKSERDRRPSFDREEPRMQSTPIVAPEAGPRPARAHEARIPGSPRGEATGLRSSHRDPRKA